MNGRIGTAASCPIPKMIIGEKNVFCRDAKKMFDKIFEKFLSLSMQAYVLRISTMTQTGEAMAGLDHEVKACPSIVLYVGC